MEVIDGIKVAHFLCKEACGIDEINVLIAVCECVFIGFLYHCNTGEVLLGRVGIIGVGYENNGKLGLCRTDLAEECLVGSLERFRRGRVVIVVHYEAGNIAACDTARNLKLAHSRARKAEITAIGIERTADYVRIGVRGARNASALRYRGAVEGYRAVGSRCGCAELCKHVEAELELFDAAVKRKVYLYLLRALSEPNFTAVVIRAVREGLHHIADVLTVRAGADVDIYAVCASVAEMVHTRARRAVIDTHAHLVRGGGEAYRAACGVLAETSVRIGVGVPFVRVKTVIFVTVIFGAEYAAELKGSASRIDVYQPVLACGVAGKVAKPFHIALCNARFRIAGFSEGIFYHFLSPFRFFCIITQFFCYCNMQTQVL